MPCSLNSNIFLYFQVIYLPAGKLENFLTGVKETHEKGTKCPINQILFFEPRFIQAVEKLREKNKIVWVVKKALIKRRLKYAD